MTLTLRWHEALDPELASAWDEARDRLDLHPFQDRVVATARAGQYRQRLRFVTGHSGKQLVFGAAVTLRRSGPWPPRLAVTRGPWACDEETLIRGIRDLAGSWPGRRPMSLRIDPHLPLPTNQLESALIEAGFATVPADFHQTTVRVDLALPQDSLWRTFRSTARNQIRHAERELETGLGTLADVTEYTAMHAAAADDGGYHALDSEWLTALMETGRAWLILSRLDGRLVGGGVFGLGGQTVHYLYGARDRQYRGPAFYAAFSEVIRIAQDRGFDRVDLGGLPHDNDGVAFFKRAFGGQEVAFTDERELIVRPQAHALWQRARSYLPHERLL